MGLSSTRRMLGIIFVSIGLALAAPESQETAAAAVEDDYSMFWDGLRDQMKAFQTHAKEEAERLKPLADQLERELQPAIAQASEHFQDSLKSFANSFKEGFDLGSPFDAEDYEEESLKKVHEKSDEVEEVEPVSDSDQPGRVVAITFDGRHPFISSMNPFNLFSSASNGMENPFRVMFQRPRRWYLGPNVCIESEIIEGDDETDSNEKTDEASDNEQELSEETPADSDDSLGGLFGSLINQRIFSSKSCIDGPTFHQCTTTSVKGGKRKVVVDTYSCCYGSTRSEFDPEPGCHQMDLKPLEEALMEVEEASDFLTMMKASAEENELLGSDNGTSLFKGMNVTIFVPTNDAVEDFHRELQGLNSVGDSMESVDLKIKGNSDDGNGSKDNNALTYGIDQDGAKYEIDEGLVYNERRRRRSPKGGHLLTVSANPEMADIVNSHLVVGFMDSKQFRDEESLQTLDGQGQIRITVHSPPFSPFSGARTGPIVLANCARILSMDHLTSNGVVHMVDKVLTPVTKTLGELLKQDVQFRSFARALENAGLMEPLLSKDSHLTVFALTEEAMARLDDSTKKLMELEGNSCASEMLRNLMIENTICSSGIVGNAKAINKRSKYVRLQSDEDMELFFEGQKVVMKDVVGTNGVIHVIDEFPLSAKAYDISEALEKSNRTEMKEILEKAGILEGISASSNANFTIFAPKEESLKTLEKDYPGTSAEDLAAFHTVSRKVCKCELQDNLLLESKHPEGYKVRINAYPQHVASEDGLLNLFRVVMPTRISHTYTAQCQKIHVPEEEETCGGAIQSISGVMEPSAKDFIKVLGDSRDYSKFLELVAAAGMEEDLRDGLSAPTGSDPDNVFTLFAPTNKAFEDIPEDDHSKILKDPGMAKEVVSNHLVEGMICCAGIQAGGSFNNRPSFKRTLLENSHVPVRRSGADRLYVGMAQIVECDKISRNGVVHAIDRVLLPRSARKLQTRRRSGQRRNSSSSMLGILDRLFS